MFHDEYGRVKNVFPFILAILTLLAAGAGVYFLLHGNSLQEQIDTIDAADFTTARLSYSNERSTEPAGVSLGERLQEDLGSDVYVTPLGFPIVSYSAKWQGEKLVEIYDELLMNTHGEELNYIAKLIVYPGRSEIGTTDSIVAGTHISTTETHTVFFDLPSLVPPSLTYSISTSQSVIELYNMDAYDSITQAARTIAHEYGHHYTMHYFMQSEQDVLGSGYYDLRNVADIDHKVFYDDQQEYLENHQWSVYEIAAEDYVQLLGSPNAQHTEEYKDIYDVLMDGSSKPYYIEFDDTITNVFPQENMSIPLAEQVPGLRGYLLSFIGQQSALEDLGTFNFDLKMTRHTNLGEVYYEITWEKPTNDPAALYTLICYDTNGQILMPVRTVYGDEKAIARVGTVRRIQGNEIATVTNAITDDDRYFRVVLIYPNGRMIASELFYADF